MTDHDRAAARPEIAVNRAAAVQAGSPASSLQDGVRLGESRIDAEDESGLSPSPPPRTSESSSVNSPAGEVNVRLWIHPDHRKKGHGTAALRKTRLEISGYFPAVPVVVRTPGVAQS